MKVPGQRAVTLALIISCGITTLTASEVQSHHVDFKVRTLTSVNHVPSSVDSALVGRESGIEIRASRDSARTLTARGPTVNPDCTSCHSYGSLETSKVDIVIAFAMAQRGKPYVYGAAGPNAYDCSGLVMRAYDQVGIHLPHYTGTMLGYGQRVSQGSMLPGDIVFPSSSHVGIYIGNGKMIVAPHSGTVIQVQSVYAFYTARRLL